jgi:hypothetical protein
MKGIFYTMAITNFIPTIWSETLYSELNKNFIAVNHCNRDFEGDIKSKGSVVNICGVGDITIKDYTANTDMTNPQELEDSVTKLEIDQAKFFNFQIDDVNKAQASPKLMEAAMQKASEAIANEADKHVFSLYTKAGATIEHDADSPDTIFESILRAREILYENNVGDNVEIFFEVSPRIATEILRFKANSPIVNENALENGYLGSIYGFKIFVCNNVDVTNNIHHCLIRTKRAIAFADQLSEVEAYRPEKRFADAVKGLHLYGAKVVYPKEMVCITFECSSVTDPE